VKSRSFAGQFHHDLLLDVMPPDLWLPIANRRELDLSLLDQFVLANLLRL
jgi:hypothetical protein